MDQVIDFIVKDELWPKKIDQLWHFFKGLPEVDLSQAIVDQGLINAYPESYFLTYQALPVALLDGGCYLGMVNPLQQDVVEEIKHLTNWHKVVPVFVRLKDLRLRMRRFYSKTEKIRALAEKLEQEAEIYRKG